MIVCCIQGDDGFVGMIGLDNWLSDEERDFDKIINKNNS